MHDMRRSLIKVKAFFLFDFLSILPQMSAVFSETYSFDSGTRPSESKTLRSRKKDNMILYKQKTKQLENIVYLISFLVFVVVILYPYFQSRSDAYDSVNDLLLNYFVIHANAMTELIGGIFMKYEMILQFMLRLTADPPFIDLVSERIIQLIKFAQITHASLSPCPSTFTLQIDNQGYCQISFRDDSSSVYNLTFLEIEDNKSCLYTFRSSEINSSDWHTILPYTQAKSIVCYDFEYNLTLLGIAPENRSEWINMYPLVSPRDNVPELMCMSSIRDKQSGDSNFGAISINMDNIRSITQEFITLDGSKFAILNFDSGVLTESSHGNYFPIARDENNLPIYPLLKDIGPFWAEVTKYLENISIHEVRSVTINETEYYLIVSAVKSNDKSTHHFVMALNRDSAVRDAYHGTTVLFIIFLVMLMIIFSLSRYGVMHTHKIKDQKLSLKQKSYLINHDTIEDCGVIGRSIAKLRQLELLYPEEILLNKVFDASIMNLSEHTSCLYLPVEDINKITCGFCDKLAHQPEKIIENDENTPFNVWSTFSYNLINGDFEYPKRFRYSFFETEPQKKLIKLTISIITQQQLLIRSIDPDALLRFLSHYINSFCRDPALSANVIYRIHSLITGSFRNWIASKVDMLALYIVAIVRNTDFQQVIDSYEEELMEADDPNHPVNMIKKEIIAFQDEYSVAERKAQFVLSLMKQFLTDQEDEILAHFYNTINNLLFDTSDKELFRILGKFRVRIESPNFSVTHNMNDRLLFMEALIKFCEFAPYFEKESTMIKGALHLEAIQFSAEDLENRQLCAEYHYEKASKIVMTWLKVFTLFNPLEKYHKHLEHNIEYWETMMQCPFDP